MYHAQFGEDRLIEHELLRITPRNQWCFEVGAGDGVKFSNVNYFIQQLGWSAALIEADPDQFRKLCQMDREGLHLFNERIGPDSLDGILARAGAPVDLDFGVIDIDGQDYYAWQGMKWHKPRLMLVEFSPYVEPDHLPGIGEDGCGGYNQAGAHHIASLGKSKGYELIAQTRVNMLFKREDA